MTRRPRHSRHPKRRLTVQTLETRRVLTATVDVTIEAPTAIDEVVNQRLTYTFNRDDTADYLAVKFELSGTAEYDVDYQARGGTNDDVFFPSSAPLLGPVTGTAMFPPGESSVQVVVTPRTDSLTEIDESVVITLAEHAEFGSINGAATRFVDGGETEYYVLDNDNRLGIVDVETGCVDVIGVIDTTIPASQTLTDIAWTEDDNLFAISPDHLYQVRLDEMVAGVIPTNFLAAHNILNANSLVDARDDDFDSEQGDLFAVGRDGLAVQWIDLDQVGDDIEYQTTATVFNISQALFNRGFHDDYIATGDIDYLRGDLVLSARRPSEDFDSLIEIETPTNQGVIDKEPEPAQNLGEDFIEIFGLAFDGNDSYAFTGSTMLSVSQFSRRVSRELELVTQEYLIGTPSEATGIIIGDPVPAPIVSFVSSGIDPSDLGKGPQPASWAHQRSSLRDIQIELGWPVAEIPAGSITLTNLGVRDTDVDVEIAIRSDQIVLSPNGTSVTITLDHNQLTDGRYQLDLSSEITTGDAFSLSGDGTNRFFVLAGDWDGSGEVNLLEFESYAYWYDQPTTVAPSYMDLNGSGTVRSGDYLLFEDRYGVVIEMPGAPTPDPDLVVLSDLLEANETVINRPNVNGKSGVTPLDALNVLNRLARGFPTVTDWRFDVNEDGGITPLDALFVINYIAVNGEGEPEPQPNAESLQHQSPPDSDDDNEVHQQAWQELLSSGIF